MDIQAMLRRNTHGTSYLRGKNVVGKNFRRQKFSSLAQNFVTFYRRKF